MKHSIKLKQGKQILGSIVAILLMGFGIALLTDPDFFGKLSMGPDKVFAMGITLVIIFCGMLFFLIYNMATKKHGLHISEEGVQDQSTAFPSGLIKWEEMIGFGLKRIVGVSFVVVYLKENEQFENRFKGLKKKMIKKNTEAYGTPVAISMALLDIKLEELKSLLEAEGAKYNLKFEE